MNTCLLSSVLCWLVLSIFVCIRTIIFPQTFICGPLWTDHGTVFGEGPPSMQTAKQMQKLCCGEGSAAMGPVLEGCRCSLPSGDVENHRKTIGKMVVSWDLVGFYLLVMTYIELKMAQSK